MMLSFGMSWLISYLIAKGDDMCKKKEKKSKRRILPLLD